MKKWESKIVSHKNCRDFETEVNRLNKEGFRTINFQVASMEHDVPTLYALMEREIPEPRKRKGICCGSPRR